MEAAGLSPHGEVDLVMSLGPTSVLDAGCGTGRVAIELQRRGVEVVGVDVDVEMLASAKAKAPDLDWRQHRLAEIRLGRTFDVAVAAGNVMVLVDAEERAASIASIADHLPSGGLLVAGFQRVFRHDRVLEFDVYDELCASCGLERVQRFATWDRQPFDGGDYAVSIHRRVS
jgi:SAM-dependent methyltransferase